MASEIRDPAALQQFWAEVAQVRAAGYREQAARFRAMAQAESIGQLRDNLIELADQYQALAVRWRAWPPLLG